MHSLSLTRVRAGYSLLRRLCVVALGGLLAACTQTAFSSPRPDFVSAAPRPALPQYAALSDGKFAVPAVSADSLDPKFARQRVRYATQFPAGTIVVDPDAKFLYLVAEGGDAIRYGIGVGREGFGWSGTAEIKRKANWPTWTPPATMIARQPELEQYRRGMEPGLGNPLGARALYLYQNGEDTLYRIHGTNEPDSIGQNVSSGCIRLLNQDVIDLFRRVPVGSKVVVLKHGNASASMPPPAGT